MLFSERYGHKPVRLEMQTDDIDEPLTNGLTNALHNLYHEIKNKDNWEYPQKISQINYEIAIAYHQDFLGEIYSPDDYRYKYRHVSWLYKMPQNFIGQTKWFEKIDFIEFVCENMEFDEAIRDKFICDCNRALERHKSAYRIVGDKVVPIIDQTEIDSVNQAISGEGKFSGAREHIKEAVRLFSDREKPAYRKSVSESISAVESVCKIIAGDENATLGQALSKVSKTMEIPNGLKKSFQSLYGYTSNEGGIRHGMLDDDHEVTFEEAKFMLVACSAFVNYLIANYPQADNS